MHHSTSQSRRISRYLLLLWRNEANQAWQRTDAQKKLHLLLVYVFLLAVFSILPHVRRDVQQPHNQATWQDFSSLGLPEQAKLQQSDCGSSIVSSQGEIPNPRKRLAAWLHSCHSPNTVFLHFWFHQITPSQINQKRPRWRCHWHLNKKTQLAGRAIWHTAKHKQDPLRTISQGKDKEGSQRLS